MAKKMLISIVVITILALSSLNTVNATQIAAIKVNGKDYTYEDYINSLYKRNTTTNTLNTNNTNTSNTTNSNTTSTNNTTNTTTSNPKKSSNAKLKELKINIEGMTPEFEEDITEYYLNVGPDIEEIEVTAKTADTKAKATVLGNEELKEGENKIRITVKAEDGTIKQYYIYVNKFNNIDDIAKESNAELESLQISNYEMYPKFKTNIFNYNININENISSLDISAQAKSETAKIEIEGNNNLKEGENIIKVKVTSENGQVVIDYKINAYILSKEVAIEEESKTPAFVLLIAIGIIIIIVGIYAIKKK